jgi:hypothetical protein
MPRLEVKDVDALTFVPKPIGTSFRIRPSKEAEVWTSRP